MKIFWERATTAEYSPARMPVRGTYTSVRLMITSMAHRRKRMAEIPIVMGTTSAAIWMTAVLTMAKPTEPGTSRGVEGAVVRTAGMKKARATGTAIDMP